MDIKLSHPDGFKAHGVFCPIYNLPIGDFPLFGSGKLLQYCSDKKELMVEVSLFSIGDALVTDIENWGLGVSGFGFMRNGMEHIDNLVCLFYYQY